MDRLGVLPTSSAAPDEHTGIKRIGRLVLLCAIVLLISAGLLVTTALQVMHSIDRADLDAERLRAANAIDTMTAHSGPLDTQHAILLGQIVGLRGAHLAHELSVDPGQQQIPLLAGAGPSGTFLTWTRTSMAEGLFRQFAPIRLPIISGMLLIVLGLLLRLRILVGDIERQRRLAHRQSRSDVVTGLGNRLAFETALTERAGGKAPFAVLVFDLDRFKDVNDAFGHAAGDEVLRTVGVRLSRLVGPDDILARIGGDEFALVSTSITQPSELSALARRCIVAVEHPIQLSGRSMQVGVSLGIVPTTAPHPAPASLVAQADAALYRAKSFDGSAFQLAALRPTVGAIIPVLARSA